MVKMAAFRFLEEARAYCEDKTRGYDEVADGDNGSDEQTR